jgi:hypothetical protein
MTTLSLVDIVEFFNEQLCVLHVHTILLIIVSWWDTENVPELHMNNAKPDFQPYITLMLDFCEDNIKMVFNYV